MKIIYTGLESSGKSLRLAKEAEKLVYRNKKWKKKSGKIRPLVSNLTFSENFYTWAVEKMEIPIIYWKNVDELVKFTEADILIDEVANYFDARNWEHLTLDMRRWLSQGAKMGIEIYGTTQSFAQVDIAFRRLVDELILIRKIIGSRRPSATKPPVQLIWGLCLETDINPRTYDEKIDALKARGLLSHWVFPITKHYCDIFNTNLKIEESALPPYKHQERDCSIPDCQFHRVLHT